MDASGTASISLGAPGSEREGRRG